MRLDFSRKRACRNRLEFGKYLVKYCARPIGHEPPCSIDPNFTPPVKPDGLKRCDHGFANLGNCKYCRGAL